MNETYKVIDLDTKEVLLYSDYKTCQDFCKEKNKEVGWEAFEVRSYQTLQNPLKFPFLPDKIANGTLFEKSKEIEEKLNLYLK